ncbi:MAG: FtsX-like permease family protein [Chitinophagales bacterium]|nr:FtsX-like permease family protein [Chitinophagales bacterium]MCZ2394586.1 FtsX-like permease family protein [Chitinophagales bacterium]
MVTAFAMAIGAAALIIVMSTFNGFEDLVKSLYKVFYTDLIILPAEGKFFTPEENLLQILEENSNIACYSQVIEENVLAEYEGKQHIFTMKGIDDKYYDVVSELSDHIYSGSPSLYYEDMPLAVLGVGVAYTLGVNLSLPNTLLNLYLPRNDKNNVSDVANAFRNSQIYARGTFAVQQDFDDNYMLVPINFAKELMNAENKISAIEIRLAPKANVSELKKQLTEKFGTSYVIKTRFEQNETLYKVMRTEKWAVFTILSFIVLIAAFNIISSLSMLVLEKKQDIATLIALGASKQTIRNIFLVEGLLISLLGASVGLLFGLGICWLQIYFGIIKMPGSSFMIDYYPVQIHWGDVILIVLVIIFISLLMSWLPSQRAIKQLSSIVPGKE